MFVVGQVKIFKGSYKTQNQTEKKLIININNLGETKNLNGW